MLLLIGLLLGCFSVFSVQRDKYVSSYDLPKVYGSNMIEESFGVI